MKRNPPPWLIDEEPSSDPESVALLRQRAERLMRLLLPHETWLLGAVANGTADEESPIYLAHVAEQSKDLAMHLVNIEIDADTVSLEALGGSESDPRRSPRGSLDEGFHLEFEGSLVQIRTVPRAQGLRRLSGIPLPELQALNIAASDITPTTPRHED